MRACYSVGSRLVGPGCGTHRADLRRVLCAQLRLPGRKSRKPLLLDLSCLFDLEGVSQLLDALGLGVLALPA